MINQKLLSVVVIFCAILSSCSRKKISDEINVRLGWQVNANSAGQIYALEHGFYKQKGLNVKIEPGGLESPSINSVISGTDQIGFANGPDLVIKAISAGAPLKIIAVIQQESYHGFIVKEKSNISRPQQWINKKVGIKYNSPTYLLYRALLNKLNISRNTIEEIPLNYSLNLFFEDKINVYPGALTNEYISMKQKGMKIKAIKPSDYGINSMGNVIFTTQKYIKENPMVIKNFLQSTQKGWEECLKNENIDKCMAALTLHNPEINLKKETEALLINRNLVNPNSIPYIGYINVQKLNSFLTIMKEFTDIKKDIDVNQLYYHFRDSI